MLSHRRVFVLLFVLCPLASATFPSFDWIEKLNKYARARNSERQVSNVHKDSIVFPSDDDDRSQKSQGIDARYGPEHPRGQEQEDFHFGSHPGGHRGQEVEDFHFGHDDQRGQEQEDFHFGSHPGDHRGQEVEEINFGHKPDHPKGQEVEEINFGHKPHEPKGQEVEDFNFGHKPKHPKGQEVEEINFGHNPHEPKGQETEEFNFGHKPDHPKGQEVEEINFGHNPHEPKGQETEEINFGQKPDHPKGQEVEEINFGHKPEHPKGQEIEEINFGHNPHEPKGQETEEFNFGHKPEDPKGQEIEEINFGHNPHEPKGQEVEDFHFGHKPNHPKSQEVEEINFGQKPHEPKGQEVEDFNFGHKPKDPKGQEVEEINFGQKPHEPKGQETEEFNFGQKPHKPAGQKPEDFNFGPPPNNHVGQEVEEINFGSKPGHPNGQQPEDIFSFGPEPDNHLGQVEEIDFGSKPKDPKDHYETKPKDPEMDWSDIFSPEEKKYRCKHKPNSPRNSTLKCEPAGEFYKECKATCDPGHQFSDSTDELLFSCEGNEWMASEDVGSEPECKPVCSPSCLNGGICIDVNQCECPRNFHGKRCQFEAGRCLNPPVAQNSQVHCNSSHCVVECFYTYSFPDGSTAANLICHQGQWKLERDDWNRLPDCKPSCNPPCRNGGSCLDYNLCQCPRKYVGPQCQYEISACDGGKLKFNGYYTCKGDNDKVTCNLNCPEGHSPDVPLADEYVCHYSTGQFQPSPVPRCVFGENVDVIKTTNTSYTVQNGHEEIGSSGQVGHPWIPKTPGECVTWKGYHYKTFDGKILRSPGENCSYTLVRDDDSTFRIVVESSDCQTSVCTRTLKIFYQDEEYKFIYKDGIPSLTVHGSFQPIPIQLYGFSVEKKGKQILVSLQTVDVNLVWNEEDHLTISVAPELRDRTSGLCGNFNNNPDDDLYTPDDYYDGGKCNLGSDNDYECPNAWGPNHCREIFADPYFEKCRNVKTFKAHQDACAWDLCRHNEAFACATIQDFVETCEKNLRNEGILEPLSVWRRIAGCSLKCPPGKIYSYCGPSVEPTCGSFEESSTKHSKCTEGCFCPEGMVLHKDTCVRRESCPCQWRGKTFDNGEKIAKDCNTCTCQKGEWICTDLKCGSRCSVTGGSHYLTFDGWRYDFLGKCAYHLVKSANYTIDVENSPCSRDFDDAFNGLSSKYSSCAKSLTIHHGRDEVKLKKHKEVFVNGVELSSLPVVLNGLAIRLASSVYLRVTLPDDTDVWWDGNSNVYIDIPGNHGGLIGGLCGTHNDNQKDDFATPEGDVEQSAKAFAEKWKVDESCDETPDPANLRPCDANPQNEIIAEKQCRKLKEETFKECHPFVDPEPFYKNCLYDVCSCQKDPKSCFCPVFADYGNECIKNKIEVLWRNEMRDCGLHCPPGQVYQPCGDSCTRTCSDISLGEEHYCEKKCAEGCSCPEGFALDSSGQCIPVFECPCVRNGLEYKPGREIIKESSEGPQFCTCEKGQWFCRPATKLEIDRDYENSQVKCNETMHQEYTTCEPAEPKTCKNMHEHPNHSTRICFPGCVCKKGYVWDSIGKVCVNASECPCHHGGRSYADGEKIQEDCNTCTCSHGSWTCTDQECSAICSTWGDSHFQTFDGRIYDFQGSCNFALAAGSLSEYDTFVVDIQIVPCGTTGISCPKSVTLKVGSRHLEEEVVFRKSTPSSIPTNLKRILVREAGLFVFAEVFDLGITVQWDRGTRVYVKADSKWKNRVKGLCGNFNNNELDDFKTPTSGETSEISPVVFADSWRLQSYCPESLPMTDTCGYRPHRKPWAVEKCAILKSETFEPCHSEVPFEPYLERCIVDTCGCDEGGDCECMCTAIAAYAEECTRRGVPVKWRAPNLCGLQCKKNSHYSPCVSTCPAKSCENQYLHAALIRTCSEESCVEGCDRPHCPPDQVFADSVSDRCVPISSCKTVCLTVNNVTYLEGDLMESDDCHSCFCSHHKKTCTGEPCPEVLESTTRFVTTTKGHHSTTPYPTTTSDCPPGQIWDDCIVTCDHVCHYVEATMWNHSQCYNKHDCVSGCRAVGLNCPSGMFLRDESTCVHKKDCPCISASHSVVKPGEVIHESDCEKCQCVDNDYECVSVCTPPVHSPNPTANYSKTKFVVTPGWDFSHEGDVSLVYHTTPLALSCPTGEFVSLIDDFTKFSASSYMNAFSSPKDAHTTGWTAGFDDADQYLQVDLGRVEPVYAVSVDGVSGKYVTGYHLLHSLNGQKFSDIINPDGKKEVFGGPFQGHPAVKRVLAAPVEARYIRFHPVSWHEEISMKIDVLGCNLHHVVSSTAPPLVPSICNKPIGVGNKHLPKLRVIVSSSKPHAGPDFIGFGDDNAWQPLTNSKAEWVELDFGDLANLTGITTKGVSAGDSWVERYKVQYTHDGLSWNPILDEFGEEMTFMGNTDGESEKKNFFKRPIRAKVLKIQPLKWHHNIALQLDVFGCYEFTHSELEVTPPVDVSLSDCNVCQGARESGEKCKCTGEEWWDGEKCVGHSECPCFVGLIAYPVGTSFTTGKCEECMCRLYGVPHCTPKECEDCPHGLQKVMTPLCGCTCKPCEENTRLCPTSNICLEESAWCDGVQDCPDDEISCTSPPPKVTPPPKVCRATCPPGYDVVYRNKTAGPAESEYVRPVKTIKSKKSVKTYRGSKKTHKKKTVKSAKLTECPPYDCVPAEEVPPTECPFPECPVDYLISIKQTINKVEGACPLYTCEPVPEFANCTVSSRNIKTFDGTEYKYDVCDHVLARDDLGAWNVSMFKTCSYAQPCVSGLLIHQNGHALELHPHNRTVLLDSFSYSYPQLEMLNMMVTDFTINPIGNSIVFFSEVYGFAVVFDASGNVRITVPGQMKSHLNGLCGLYNGDPHDDKTLPDGKLSKTTVDFGNSWFRPGGKECVETACPIDMQTVALETCRVLKEEPFTSCHGEVNMETCVENTCNCLTSNKTEDECRCEMLSDFVIKCQSPDLFGWRVEHDCPSSCPPNLVHYDCYPYACEPTCGNEDCDRATECHSGCFCPDGRVKRGDQCVKLQDCRDCVCNGMGDSTYLTFDGGLTFNGNCTYVATREKNPSGIPDFEVLITNNLCHGSDFMTCTEKVEIKVPGHSIKLVALPETEEKVKVYVDGHARTHEEIRQLKETWAEVELSPEASSVHVELPKEHVEVRYFYNRFAFTISLPSHYYSDKVEGLCGTCSRIERNPEDIESPEVWQTEKDESCLIEPPIECLPTPEHERICNFMNNHKIFGQCLNFVDPTPFVEQCLVTLCSNGHVCDSLEAYAQACRDSGICVDWRSYDYCPFTCALDLEYQPCKSGCFKTCDNYNENATSCLEPPVEGCFCPDEEVLINGTCKSAKYCEYCDLEGRHYEGDSWQADKCTNCTCNDHTVKCNKRECPGVDVVCEKDEVPVKEESEFECCPKYKCGCKPRHECPKVELPNEVLPLGMEATINETGCCPKLEIVCRKDTCPHPKPCKTHYIKKMVNVTDCCPHHICEKPENICIYDFEEEHPREEKRGKRESPKEVVKEVGERWTDGPCKSCVCTEKNGIAEAVCKITECSPVEEHHDFDEYELTHEYNSEKCCPEIVRKNCKHNGTVYHVGDSWMPDENNPCETMKCNAAPAGGQILKETRMEFCNDDCEKGWVYQHASGECCGHCVQVGCVAGDKIYKDEEVWFSEDGCVKSSCVKKNGHFVISTMTESCPSLEDCPEEDIYQDKCCRKCKIRAENKRICTPTPLPPEKTVKLIREKKGRHGLCQNPHPVANFTQCAGNCDSFTEYKPDTWSHESVCKCCTPQEFSLLTVELKCEDGLEVMKSITVPSKCSCMPCGG